MAAVRGAVVRGWPPTHHLFAEGDPGARGLLGRREDVGVSAEGVAAAGAQRQPQVQATEREPDERRDNEKERNPMKEVKEKVIELRMHQGSDAGLELQTEARLPVEALELLQRGLIILAATTLRRRGGHQIPVEGPNSASLARVRLVPSAITTMYS